MGIDDKTDKKDLLLYLHNKETNKITTFTLIKMIEYLYETKSLDENKDHIFINRNDIPNWLLARNE